MNWSEILTVNSDPSKPLNELITESSGAIGHKKVRAAFGTGQTSSSNSTVTVLQVAGGNKKKLLGVVVYSPAGGVTFKINYSKNNSSGTCFSCKQTSTSKHIAFLTNDYIRQTSSYIAYIPNLASASSVIDPNYSISVNSSYTKCAYTGLNSSVSDNALFIMQPIENLDSFTITATLSSTTTVKAFAIYEQD